MTPEVAKRADARRALLDRRRRQLSHLRSRLEHRRTSWRSRLGRGRPRGLVWLALLVGLLPRPRCIEPPPPSDPKCPEPVVAVATPPEAASPPEAMPSAAPVYRPRFVPPAPNPPLWLVSFRRQVAARSRRMAECFEGTDRPGQIRWVASIDLATGWVAEQAIEPTLWTHELPGPRRQCLERALGDRRYMLPPTDPGSPNRVSLVLEF